jgi:hypothetical protein
VNEVPRRQITGGGCPREIVAEIEDRVAEVVEDEMEDVAKPGLQIESAEAGVRVSRCDPGRFPIQFCSIAAPKISAARFTNRGAKIASGPIKEKE